MLLTSTTRYLHQNRISFHSQYILHLQLLISNKYRHHLTCLELFNKQPTIHLPITTTINTTTHITTHNQKPNPSKPTSNSQATIRLSHLISELTSQTTNLHMKISLLCLHLQATFQQSLRLLLQQMGSNSFSQATRPKAQMIHSICFLD
jgi:hypothetical protein